MKKKLFFLSIIFVVSTKIFAIPVFPDLIFFTQPNNDELDGGGIIIYNGSNENLH